MAQAKRDENRVTTLMAVTDDSNLTPTNLVCDATTKRLKVSAIITSGGGITSLGGQTGGTQTFANDTNVTMSSAADTHTLGWTGTLAVARGGTGTGSAGITAFNNITGYTAAGATGTTSTNLVFSTSPTLVTPILGTPTSGTLTNCTGLPMTTGVTGVLAVANGGTNASSAGITAFNNITGYTAAGATGTTSTNLVFSTSPTLVTPVLGAATATTINGATITTTSGGTLTLANSSTLATSGANSITLTSTGATNVTLPTTGTLATLAGSEEFDNKTLDSSVGKGTWTASGTWTLPAFTLGGDVTFSENVSLILDPSLSADGKYCGITEAGTAGEALAFGDLVYFKAADSRWWLTDADADATAGAVMVAICVLAAGAGGNATTVLRYGKIRADAAFPDLTVGAPAYISTTAGDVQVAQPSGTDDVIRIVGYGITANEMLFNPSSDWITHT